MEVDHIRAVDHDIATGVYPDMTEHGWSSDEWPALHERIMAADILVLVGPIWLGDNSSVMKKVIETYRGGCGDGCLHRTRFERDCGRRTPDTQHIETRMA